MNMTPVIRQLDAEDFKKMYAACRGPRERFYLKLASLDPDFEYHVDLPAEDQVSGVSHPSGGQGSENSAACGLTPETSNLKPGASTPLSDMPGWLADGKRFPND